MNDYYLTVSEPVSHEIVINKSRFIGFICHVSSEALAKEAIEHVKANHLDATHNCYGYIIGIDGSIKRFSDDGEPGGTAGMPIIQVISQQGLVNTIIIVTRYFGGIKLGAGGLVRAYSKTAAETITKAKISKMEYSTRGNITIDYNQIGSLEHYLKSTGMPIEKVDYSEKVTMTIIVKGSWEDYSNHLIDRFNGCVSTIKIDDMYYCWS